MLLQNNPANPDIQKIHGFVDQELINALPIAVYTCNTSGEITFFNDAAVRLWGRKPEIGQEKWCGSWKISNPNGTALPLYDCPMAIALREKRAVTGQEIVVERPDGIKLNVIPHPKPIFSESGEMLGAINTLVDVTENSKRQKKLAASEKKYKSLNKTLEKKVEKRTLTLKRSEERYFKMIEEVQDYAIILLDSEGNILNWNKGAENIKGYSEKEIIGRNFRIFYRDEDRKSQLPEQLINLATVHGKAMHEGWRVRKDGSMFWGNIVITALHDSENNIIGFSKVTRDLTERKKADDQLRAYAHDIEVQNKQLEEYAYIASHDLQEPLRKILIFAELLESNLNDEEAARRNLAKINASALRMSALIKDVLNYSQVSSKDLLTEVGLNEVVVNVLKDFDLLIEQRNVTVNIDTLPTIKGIPVQLHQLFSNLVSNAIKFSTEDPVINISYETEVSESKHNFYKIVFSDNGVGFDPKYAEQVFQLFQRLNTKKQGTGIGLALCKKIIDNHNGHVVVDSEPGKGTTFNIYLPVM